jgi:single-stranded-DNA-specific exonuclease
MEIKNLKKAANRILKAIKKKERIILYGDADLDGTTSVIILKETIKNLGGNNTVIYFPDREKEGYGINEIALNYLKKFAPALFLAFDCGISNFKEVILAKKMGFEVIIIDHHEILDRLPKASIIVDPKQKGDKYPFKELANAGIAFKLSQVLLKEKFNQSLRKNFLELAALATIADSMPAENENKTMIEEGLFSLENSWRPGIRAFLEMGFPEDYLNFRQKVFKIISLLNIRDVQNQLPASFRLLTISSLKEAKEMVKSLSEKAVFRKQRINEIIEQVEEKILIEEEEPIIFVGDDFWELTLLGPVASLILQKYKKPVFLFKKDKNEAQGTIRTPNGVNSIILLKKCKKYLLTYGGHPRASGFRLKNENLEEFKECLIKNRVFVEQKRR